MNGNLGAACLDHIGFGVHDLSVPMRFFSGTLGARPYAGGSSPGFVGAQWEFLDGERLEAIVPAGPSGGFLHRFLDQRGPGVHHVTFKVPDLRAAADAASRHGYDVVGFDDTNPGWKEAFLHPRQAQGIVIQFAEADPDLDDDWNDRFEFPRLSVPPAPRAARVAGLRLCAKQELAVRKLWSDLAGGHCEHSDGELVFHWPNSPLRIAVSLNSDRREGPLAVELDSYPPAAVHEDPVQGIGARFVPTGTIV